MGWIRRWWGGGADAAPADGSGLGRWVVLDLETSGFDLRNDALLAIGAVAVVGGRARVGDSFEIVVRPPRTSSRENILVHGIGAGAQREGVSPAEACEAFLAWAGDAPFAAFHAPFDRAFLARTVKQALGRTLANPWLDVADLAPVLYPGVRARALDEWLEHFGIGVDQRHHAASDALATAALLLRLLAQVPPAQRTDAGLLKLAADARWLARQG